MTTKKSNIRKLSRTALQRHRRNWDAAFSWYAENETTLNQPARALFLYLLKRTRYSSRFTVSLSNETLQTLPGLISKNALVRARQVLADKLGIIRANREDKSTWTYELLNPVTGEAFSGQSGADKQLRVVDAWGKVTWDLQY